MTHPIYVPPNPHRDVSEMRAGETWIYRYIPKKQVNLYEEKGWVFRDDLGPTHGEWSKLMLYTLEGEPAE